MDNTLVKCMQIVSAMEKISKSKQISHPADLTV